MTPFSGREMTLTPLKTVETGSGLHSPQRFDNQRKWREKKQGRIMVDVLKVVVVVVVGCVSPEELNNRGLATQC